MRKILSLAMAVFALTFCACDKDDYSSSSGKLIGRWEVYKIVAEYGSFQETNTEWGDIYGCRMIYDFINSSVCQITDARRYGNNWDTDTENIPYELKNGNIILYFSDSGAAIYKIEKLTSSELVFSCIDPDDGSIERTYLKSI